MTDTRLKKWKTHKSDYLVSDRWIKLRSDVCETPDGHTVAPYYVLEYPDWVSGFAVDDEGNALLIRQYRHGVADYVLEIVGGGIEPSDPSPEAAVRRELEEELGYTGGEIYPLGVMYSNPASHTNKVYPFFAFGGSCKRAQNLEASETLHIEKMPFKECVDLFTEMNSTEVYQSIHLAAVYRALEFMRTSGEPRIKALYQQLGR